MTFVKSKPCAKCGAPVNRAGGPRAGLTANHTPRGSEGPGIAFCTGSDMPWDEHSWLVGPVSVRVVGPVEIREVAMSTFHKTLARLRGHSVTWVDFLGARMARASGKVNAMKFVLQEVRDA